MCTTRLVRSEANSLSILPSIPLLPVLSVLPFGLLCPVYIFVNFSPKRLYWCTTIGTLEDLGLFLDSWMAIKGSVLLGRITACLNHTIYTFPWWQYLLALCELGTLRPNCTMEWSFLPIYIFLQWNLSPFWDVSDTLLTPYAFSACVIFTTCRCAKYLLSNKQSIFNFVVSWQSTTNIHPQHNYTHLQILVFKKKIDLGQGELLSGPLLLACTVVFIDVYW